ncbi:hypothetical protein CTI12_AA492510 [Artemisia annua]|uniref:Uncharacterized protein n=1 Tax=Artemisia annua TaxID=35608 RepID=A0A2U1KP91_ARTAN|nr:hypothetical protein CTI12_AA492510 [Artemisia annua]
MVRLYLKKLKAQVYIRRGMQRGCKDITTSKSLKRLNWLINSTSQLDFEYYKQPTITIFTTIVFFERFFHHHHMKIGPSPLRRSERGHNLDDGHATNVKPTKVKTANISKEIVEDVNEDGNVETQDPPEVRSRKRKRFNAIRFKAWFKPQRVRVESGTIFKILEHIEPFKKTRLSVNLTAISDTCMAMGQWVDNPHAETALSNILPCVDQATTNATLYKSKLVVNDIANIMNGFIGTYANANAPQGGNSNYYNQSGPLLPYLCYPYDSQLRELQCPPQLVSIANASEVWENYTCTVSESGSCTTAGRLTPDMYQQLVGAVNISYGLQHYAPPLLSLQDCNFVRETFKIITSDYCPPLEDRLRMVNAGLGLVSVGVMLSLALWIIYANRPQREEMLAKISSEFKGRGNGHNINIDVASRSNEVYILCSIISFSLDFGHSSLISVNGYTSYFDLLLVTFGLKHFAYYHLVTQLRHTLLHSKFSYEGESYVVVLRCKGEEWNRVEKEVHLAEDQLLLCYQQLVSAEHEGLDSEIGRLNSLVFESEVRLGCALTQFQHYRNAVKYFQELFFGVKGKAIEESVNLEMGLGVGEGGCCSERAVSIGNYYLGLKKKKDEKTRKQKTNTPTAVVGQNILEADEVTDPLVSTDVGQNILEADEVIDPLVSTPVVSTFLSSLLESKSKEEEK